MLAHAKNHAAFAGTMPDRATVPALASWAEGNASGRTGSWGGVAVLSGALAPDL